MAAERGISIGQVDMVYINSHADRLTELFADTNSPLGRRLNLLDRLGRSINFILEPEELSQNLVDTFHDVLDMAADQKSEYQKAAKAALMGLTDSVEHELRILDQLESSNGYAMRGMANLVSPLVLGTKTINGGHLKHTKDGIDFLGKSINLRISARAS